MKKFSFFKMQALGNDFIVFRNPETDVQPFTQKLCQRKTGIGADSVLVLKNTQKKGTYDWLIYNSDGSLALNCGNGLRCLKQLVDILQPSNPTYFLNHLKVQQMATRQQDLILVQMGIPQYKAQSIPYLGEHVQRGLSAVGKSKGHVLKIGNPHAVFFDLQASIENVQSILKSGCFPEGVNIQFSTVKENRIFITVYEKGVGFTQACGSGACAAAMAGWNLGLIKSQEVQVEMKMGSVLVSRSGQMVLLKGDAKLVFQGQVELEE